MDKNRWQHVEAIVDQALTLPKEERNQYINEECKGDKQLKTSVTELLKSIEESEGYLENPVEQQDELLRDFARELESLPSESSMIGQRIGAYKITDLLGHGGMGSVFLAERADGAFEHKVAFKLVRRGMDTPENVARFQRERAILANLNHPHIGRMYDGGLTDDGLPYLIMEYIDGMPVDEYCRQNNCSLQERLELFKSICEAVQHAHKNLAIHRDLKPGNIMVDRDGQVKILDFGIAKLLEQEQSGQNLFETRAGKNMLTLAYAAPEQLTGASITTAADIYALGVMLHELLAGVHPFDFEDKNIAEIEEIIKEETVPLPSTQARFNRSQLKGDLDTIISKMLRKNPENRYSSAGELLEEIRRYEQGLPITAHEGSFRYNISKFTKRHKTGILAIAVIVVMAISFGIFYTYQITQERNQAQLEAEKAEQVSNFLVDLFSASNPYFEEGDGGLDVKVGSVLRYGADQLDSTLRDQPEIRAELQSVIGEVYNQLGEFGKAESLLTQAVTLRKNFAGNASQELANSLRLLGFVHQEQGNYGKADSLLRQAISVFKKSEEGLQTEMGVTAVARLGNLQWFNKGDYKAADSLLKEALAIREQLHQGDHIHISISLNDLAALYHAQGKYETATPYYRRSIEMYKRLFSEHSSLAVVMSNFAALLREEGRLEEAEQFQLESLAMHRKLTGEEGIDVALGMGSLGHIYLLQGRFQEADSLLKISVKDLTKIYGNSHPYIARTKLNQGKLYLLRREFEEAENLLSRVNSEYEQIFPSNHPRTSDPHLQLGLLYLETDELRKAGEHLKKAHHIRKQGYPADSWRVAQTMNVYGACLSEQQQFGEADSLLVRGYEILRETRGASDRYTQEAVNRIISHYERWEKPGRANQFKSKLKAVSTVESK